MMEQQNLHLKECLKGFLTSKELAPFGIRVIIVQRGAFNIDILSIVPLVEKANSVIDKDTDIFKM